MSKLALHFWRPDFTAQQAAMLFADFYEDLAEFTPVVIQDACMAWRRNGENKFFPTPGQLLGILRPADPDASPRLRLKTFVGLPQLEGPRATKTAAQVLAEHGLKMPERSQPPPMPHTTDLRGPVTAELRESVVARRAMANARPAPPEGF